ncbi:cell division protein FtsA [Colwellia sp. 4_MG-2023]|jgi:cell division protein FtsA|uniref:cell division protein FtsA n=1 Tax=unclassified Colwellia TaxID=196834 RepID=UPI001C08AB0D|nr:MULTISPECIES: cell division protein FtsA [unclassified Colwellia]MBU2926211.1 cell division protein FtsA [Colwellia sp. C2M11]MDO6487290.1 cell division protein FtsA [Colwellia sp. 6_MG-2023]MDO6507181.1 cell division protein FtsA [Colwellia sp. 5_MG-2023]MDO6556017.1 cell division protein FtsA [Colwellia sp. 4_MG-2023]MDO6652368.1 cell division protein FtsA [Colwellia sp. 3_MG-2023]
MSKITERNLVVGLDIGTSKISVAVGEITPDNQLSIVGVGNQPARGMDKGGVNDLNLVIQSIQRAINEAELMADCQISSIYLDISGKHISCQNENGMVPINDKEVVQEDVDNVIHTARSVPISAERRMLHVLPQEYSIDCQDGIKSPIGMSGVRMEAKVHIITCANDMAKNLVKCVERCNLTADQLIFSALASSYSILTDDEKELGICVVDMGAGTMDISIFTGGALRHTAVIPVAGNQVTSDIAKIFRTPLSHAEDIKVQYACALRHLVSMEESIDVPSVGGRPARTMSRHTLSEVVEPRYQELFELIQDEVREAGLEDQIAAGYVLTGGTSKMEGVEEFAEEVFQMPVRIASPIAVQGLKEYVDDPTYATVVGLLHYGMKAHESGLKENNKSEGVTGAWSRFCSWFKGEF